MRKVLSICLLLLLHGVLFNISAALKPADYSWENSIRKEHPRLFLNKQDISRIKKNVSGQDKPVFDAMKMRIDLLLDQPVVFKDLMKASGESSHDHEWGTRAAEAAFLWLVTGERKYLDYTKNLLVELSGYYQYRADHNYNVTRTAYSQICAICAYDWVYNGMDKDERARTGRLLFNALNDVAWHSPARRAPRPGEDTGDYTSGCCGPSVLPWYLGLAFLGDGVDDEECRTILHEGYDFFQKMSDHRSEMAGENGGGVTACASFSFADNPYADFNFIYSMKAATGIDISEDMSYVLDYLKYLDWIRLPYNREFGFGDVYHYSCLLPEKDINAHIFHINNIYGGTHPEIRSVVERLKTQFKSKLDVEPLPFLRLLKLPDPKLSKDAVPETPARSMYFDTMGQVYMRSGTGDDDTYAMFVSGGKSDLHKHFDNNNFIIYKKGYRAVDSGSRPEPGLHLSHYYCRTVAHNCVTIRMPEEVMPTYWGGPALGEDGSTPVPNDGGQSDNLGSKLLEYTETLDWVYLASDATACYSAQKVSQVVREFIWLSPDLFIIADRVVAMEPTYRKAWLWHTINEPQMLGEKEWKETSEGGSMICRTILPEGASQELIGGPGKDFWADGRNWPLPVLCPDDWGYRNRRNIPSDSHPQLGHWRLEVSPDSDSKIDFFLHMLMVGDNDLRSMPKSTYRQTNDEVILSFEYNAKTYSLTFDKSSNHGCKIEVK